MEPEFKWVTSFQQHSKELWKFGQKIGMPQFLERFTLHDSQLEGTHLNPNFGATLFIDLDLVWNKTIPEGYSNVVIKFNKVYRIAYRHGLPYGATIGDAASKLVTAEEREQLLQDEVRIECKSKGYESTEFLEDPKLTRTRIDGIFGDQLELLHSEDVQILFLNDSSEPLQVKV